MVYLRRFLLVVTYVSGHSLVSIAGQVAYLNDHQLDAGVPHERLHQEVMLGKIVYGFAMPESQQSLWYARIVQELDYRGPNTFPFPQVDDGTEPGAKTVVGFTRGG